MRDVLCHFDVSRETKEKLDDFARLVSKWNQRINLVSKTDVRHLWDRHIVDSVQIASLAQNPENWLDLGSGGGFPSIVVAIVVQDKKTQNMVCVESDARKCVFLKTAVRELGLNVNVQQVRAEDFLVTEPFEMVSARALAPLTKLLEYSTPLIKRSGFAIFPKGKNWKEEVRKAERSWSFDLDVIESLTDPEAAVLRLNNIQTKSEASL